MKLKQRVIVTGSMLGTMITLFVIGVHLSWPGAEQINEKRQTKDEPKLPPRKISSISNNQPEVHPPVKVREPYVPPKPPDFVDIAKQMQLRNSVLGRPPFLNMSDPLLMQNRFNPPPGLIRGPPSREDLMRKPPSLDLNSLPDFLREKIQDFRQDQTPPPPSSSSSSPPPVTTLKPTISHHRTELNVSKEVAKRDPWKIWQDWVKPNYLYPEGAFWSDKMNHILKTMATAPITEFGVGYKGTQLKATLKLNKQRTVFKPKRYERDTVLTGTPYVGYDRHNGEIAGFHLDGLLGFRIAPPVVGRKINLTAIRPVTTKKLLDTYVVKDGNVCFYGKCYYCNPNDLACASGEIMEGSVTLWLPEWYTLQTRRHPYQRTYRDGVKARWETDNTHCNKLLKPSSEYYYGLLELTDSAVFDYLMGNADRHHYETYSKAEHHGRIMHIDNGKTFGNPHHDERSILAPLYQCCRLRSSTYDKLLYYNKNGLSQALDKSLQRDPLWPILTDDHLRAIDRRLIAIVDVVEHCIKKHGIETVIVKKWS